MGAAALPERIGPFRLAGTLGRGGMGVVYRAVDERLGREVALKVLLDWALAQPGRRERFLREARAAAAVVHPAIATVFEVGEADRSIYIAMELIEGKTLRELGQVSVDEALRLGREIAEAIARAHAAGVVHRDLKPENVMVAPDGRVKVLDFGLAKVERVTSALDTTTPAGAVTAEGAIMGTPQYMAPEQARGRPTDARTDVFALGLILYELLTGEPAFKGETAADLIAGILTSAPPAVSSKNASVPVDLERVIARCLEKQPAERYQNATRSGRGARGDRWKVAVSSAISAPLDRRRRDRRDRRRGGDRIGGGRAP